MKDVGCTQYIVQPSSCIMHLVSCIKIYTKNKDISSIKFFMVSVAHIRMRRGM